MCQFCTEHGEGKKWYLEIKNYADELLYEELSSDEQETVGVTTRVEYLNNLFEDFIMPAISAVPEKPAEPESEPPSDELPDILPSEDDALAARQLEHFGQLLPIEDVEEVIDIASSITRMACGCRFVSTGQKDERYHFGLMVDKRGTMGKFPDAASSLEVLEKEETKRMFREYDQEGLMHIVWTAVTPYVMALCNCDRDCLNYKGLIEKGGVPRFFRGEYVSQINPDVCNGCKACMAQCLFGAQSYSSALEKVYIDPTRCFGCGLCRAVCAEDAITLLLRQDVAEAANVWLK